MFDESAPTTPEERTKTTSLVDFILEGWPIVVPNQPPPARGQLEMLVGAFVERARR